MFDKFNRNKAQTTLEYAILIGIVVAGLIAMQVYLKRGYQGKLRESADSMGQQFSPGNTTNTYTVVTSSSSNEEVSTGETDEERVTVSTINDQTTRRTGTENVATSDQEFWWE